MSRSKGTRSKLSFTVPMDPPKKREKRPVKPSQPADSDQPEQKKQKEASLPREASSNVLESTLIARLIVASILFCVVIIFSLPTVIETLVLLFAAAIAGVELILQGIAAVSKRDYTNDALLTVAIIAIAFVIGFGVEGAMLTILYQVSMSVIRLLIERCRMDAVQMADRESSLSGALEKYLRQAEGSDLAIRYTMEQNVAMPLLGAKLLAVVYAVLFPIFTHYSIRVAVHRAITILLVTTPFSMLAAMPAVGMMGMGFAAANGTLFSSARKLESLSSIRTLILDKLELFQVQPPKLLYAHSDVLDDATFMNFVFHVVHESRQGFARVICEGQDLTYDPSIVTGFQERPGGIKAKIGTAGVLFGTRSFLTECGVRMPEFDELEGVYYYLFLQGHLGGIVVLSEDDSGAIGDIVQDFRYAGIRKCILTCPESAEEVSSFAEKSHFDEVFSGTFEDNRDSVLHEICQAEDGKTLLVTHESDLPHSEAELEVRVAAEAGEADALTLPNYFTGIPLLFGISQRMDEIAMENAVGAFVVKALIIFLSMIGYCNLWIAIIMETLAVVATILNANRVTSRSLIRTFMDK